MYLEFFNTLTAYVTQRVFSSWMSILNAAVCPFFFLNKLISCYHTFPLLTYKCLNNSWETAVVFIARDKNLLY